MGRADFFKFGDYNAICQKCGFKYKASTLKLQWNGFRVCKTCWNPRQPQDFVRGVPDTQTPPWSLPDQAQTFVPSCTVFTQSAISGVAVSGCEKSGYVAPGYYANPIYDPENPGFPEAPNTGYTEGLTALKTSRAKALPLQTYPYVVDGYNSQAGINEPASTGWMYDSRGAFEPTRSGGQTVLSSTTSSYTGWTADNSGTGTNTLFADPNNPYVAGQNSFDFNTNGTIGSLAGAKISNIGSVPQSFGIFFQSQLVATSINLNDSLLITLGNVSGNNLQLQLNSAGFWIFLSGSWQQLFRNGGGNYYTEWWVDCVWNGTNYTVQLLAGTQLVGTLTGNLPGSGVNGQLIIQQQSGTTANMHSRLAGFNVGTTQAADNITLVSDAFPALVSPTNVRVIFLYEDTSVSLAVNSNFLAYVSQDGGTTWEQIPLTNLGIFGPGIVDNTKNIYELVCLHQFSNSGGESIVYKLVSEGNNWFALAGAYMEWGI